MTPNTDSVAGITYHQNNCIANENDVWPTVRVSHLGILPHILVESGDQTVHCAKQVFRVTISSLAIFRQPPNALQ